MTACGAAVSKVSGAREASQPVLFLVALPNRAPAVPSLWTEGASALACHGGARRCGRGARPGAARAARHARRLCAARRAWRPPLAVSQQPSPRCGASAPVAGQPDGAQERRRGPRGGGGARCRRTARGGAKLAGEPRRLRRRAQPAAEQACDARASRSQPARAAATGARPRLLSAAPPTRALAHARARRCCPGAATRWLRGPCSPPPPPPPWRCSTPCRSRTKKALEPCQQRLRPTSAASCARPATPSWLLRARWRRCRPSRISSPPSRCGARRRLFVAPRPFPAQAC